MGTTNLLEKRRATIEEQGGVRIDTGTQPLEGSPRMGWCGILTEPPAAIGALDGKEAQPWARS